ncbi:response regulator transcription factor [Glaciibacter flavus]|uniref:response regulator transcription factor n=1 Tax=Orlajensenia flava TaxID=2565934 RepID=UPI003AFF7926
MSGREAVWGTHPVRVGLLDDHELLLDSMSSWIRENAPDFRLSLTAPRWVDFVRSEAFPVDLVIMDFQLVEPVSIEARIRTCRAAGCKVVVISALDTDDARERATAAGAIAFVAKSVPMQSMIGTVRAAMRMPEPNGDDVQLAPGSGRVSPVNGPHLSLGETQALRLYVSGLSTAEVAARMHVKYETAKTYLRRVREKYQKAGRPASRKVDLIRRAAEDGHLE